MARHAISLVTIFVLTLALIRSASGDTLPLAMGIGTSGFSVTLRASDCCSSVLPINDDVHITDHGTGSVDFTIEGILDPASRVHSFEFGLKPVAFNATIGVDEIPITLTFEEISFRFSDSSGSLAPGIVPGENRFFNADTVVGLIRGTLTASGTTRPFEFSDFPCEPCFFGSGFGITGSAPAIFIDSFESVP